METKSRLSKLLMYQNLGFLFIILLGFLDDLLKLPSLIFRDHPFAWRFGQSTLGMLLVLGVWFLVSTSTRRLLNHIHYLEKFLRVCSWCHQVDYKDRWMPMEEFMRKGFTHGICPKCLEQQRAAMAKAGQMQPSHTETCNTVQRENR